MLMAVIYSAGVQILLIFECTVSQRGCINCDACVVSYAEIMTFL